MRVNIFQIFILTYIVIVAATVASFILVIGPLGYPFWALVVFGIAAIVLVVIGAMFVFAAVGIRHGTPKEYELGLKRLNKV